MSIQKYDYETAATIFHMFLVFAYVTPTFGAILSDSYWGKYKTIYILSIVHVFGNIIVALASMITTVDLQIQRLLTIVGLLLLAIGAGGIKPCVSSFGGDQFVFPDQEEQLRKFFPIFFFSINAGSLMSTAITPELRKSVQCLGQDTCFPLAFGVPALLMAISIVIFVWGKCHYTKKKPTTSIITTSVSCVCRALKNKITAPSNEPKKKDWLEYAGDKYDKHTLHDLRMALDVMVMFVPIPIFNSLFHQQGSSWIIQATLMNGKIDFLNWTLKPDQVHLISPLCVLIFLPLFESVVYPILRKIGINTPLRKITLGGFISALSFVCAAAVQYTIMDEKITISPNEVHVKIYNNIRCNVNISNNLIGNFVVEPLDTFRIDYSLAVNETELSIDLDPMCQINSGTMKYNISTSNAGQVSSYVLSNTQVQVVELTHLKQFRKLKSGKANLMILHDNYLNSSKIILRDINNKNNLSDIIIQLSSNIDQNYDIPIGTYNLHQYTNQKTILKEVVFLPFSVNSLLLHKSIDHTNAKMITLEKGKFIHLLWQVPQIIILTIAETMVLVTLMEFAYTQAPISMKSFISSIYLITTGVGNLIIVMLSKLKLFKNYGDEFIFYATLMTLSMFVFMFLSVRYKYKYITEKPSKTEEPFLNE